MNNRLEWTLGVFYDVGVIEVGVGGEI